MIGFLKGKVLSKTSSGVLIDVSGVGYEVQVSKSTLHFFNEGSPVSLWIYTSFRQETLELFGFSQKEEKHLFLSLLKVKGVGPRMALSLLGSCSLKEFVVMIRDENIKALTSLPRVGKKMAHQIVLTLKDEVSEDSLVGSSLESQYSRQLFTALESLGYGSSEIRGALSKIKWEEDLQKDLAQALSHLSSS